MSVGIGDVTNTLQKVIMPYIRDNFPTNTIFLDQVKRNSDVTYFNDNFYAPVRTGRHAPTRLANDKNKLVSGGSTYGQASVGVKILTGTFDITKLAISATKSVKGAVESQLARQAKDLTSDFAKSVNQQMYNDGVEAWAQCAGSTSATEFPVEMIDANGIGDDGRLKDRYGTINGDIQVSDYFQPGQVISIGSVSSAAVGTVSSAAAGTVFVTGAPCPIDQDIVYFVDGSGEGEGTAGIGGLGLALNSATGTALYAGLARSTYGWATQFGSQSEALTLSRMAATYVAAAKYAQKGDRYAIFVNKTLFIKYGDILTAMRRAVNQTDLLGGWTGLEFAAGDRTIGVFLDYDVPDGEVLIVNLDTLTVCQVEDIDWLENPSSGSMHRRDDYITYQSTMVWFMNLMCLCPAANGKLTQKTD